MIVSNQNNKFLSERDVLIGNILGASGGYLGIGHTAWAPEGRKGRSQEAERASSLAGPARSQDPEGLLTSSIGVLQHHLRIILEVVLF